MFRQKVKFMIYGVSWIVTSPIWLAEKASRRLAGRDVWFVTQSEILSLLPGKLGRLVRSAYYKATLESCPYHVCLQFGCLFAYSRVRVGQNVYLGLHSKVGLVDIGDGTIISDDVQLLSGAHQHSTAESSDGASPAPGVKKNIRSDLEPERISIGRDCWIGTRAIIMADIGDNCIIGAGAVVTRPIPSNSVAVGVPARVIRKQMSASGSDQTSVDAERDLASARF